MALGATDTQSHLRTPGFSFNEQRRWYSCEMCNRKSLHVCMCVWILLMSWEAGQLCKKIEASWWGVVATLWWPRFRTQTHTHIEVDQVYAMRSGRCVGRRGWRENTRRWGGKKPSYFFSWIHIVVQWWPQAGHMPAIWATGGQSYFAVVNRQSKWIKNGATIEEQLRDENVGLDKLTTRLKLPQIWFLFVLLLLLKYMNIRPLPLAT